MVERSRGRALQSTVRSQSGSCFKGTVRGGEPGSSDESTGRPDAMLAVLNCLRCDLRAINVRTIIVRTIIVRSFNRPRSMKQRVYPRNAAMSRREASFSGLFRLRAQHHQIALQHAGFGDHRHRHDRSARKSGAKEHAVNFSRVDRYHALFFVVG